MKAARFVDREDRADFGIPTGFQVLGEEEEGSTVAVSALENARIDDVAKQSLSYHSTVTDTVGSEPSDTVSISYLKPRRQH